MRLFDPRVSGRDILLPVMHFSKLVFIALLAAQSHSFAQTPPGSGLDPARLQTVRPRKQALVDNQTIPAAVALVARHGQVAFLDAVRWRDIETNRPMHTDSIVQITTL